MEVLMMITALVFIAGITSAITLWAVNPAKHKEPAITDFTGSIDEILESSSSSRIRCEAPMFRANIGKHVFEIHSRTDVLYRLPGNVRQQLSDADAARVYNAVSLFIKHEVEKFKV